MESFQVKLIASERVFHFVPHARGQKLYQLPSSAEPPEDPPKLTEPYFCLWLQFEGKGCDEAPPPGAGSDLRSSSGGKG